jgi:hypothetical protein
VEDDFSDGFAPEEEGREAETEAGEGPDDAESADTGVTEEEESAAEETGEPEDAEGRGAKILADREAAKAKAAEQAAELKRTAEAATAAAKRPTEFFAKVDAESMKYFTSLVENYLPEGVMKVGEVDADLRQFAHDNPEVVAIAGVIANNHLQQLVNLGMIPTQKAVDGNVTKLVETKLFDFAVKQTHADADAVVDSAAFKEFISTATPAVRALFETENPRDFILGLNKFKGATASKKAQETTSLKKKAHDTLHSSPLRPGLRRQSKASQTPMTRVEGVEDDFAAGFTESGAK